MQQAQKRNGRHTSRRFAAMCAVALLLCSVLTVVPRAASAEPQDDIASLAERIEQANDDYDGAVKSVNDVKKRMAELQKRIDTISAQLPEQREKSANSIRTLYKFQRSRGGLLDLVLASDDFSTLLSTLQYLNVISEKNTDEITSLIELQHQLEVAQTSLKAEKAEAEKAREKAASALEEAEDARAEAEARAAAQAKAEEEERQAALEEAKKAEAEKKSFTTASGNTSKVSADTKKSDSGSAHVDHDSSAVESEDKPSEHSNSSSDSVDAWAARIDAYLEGSPLAGQGRNFAEAALRYGVDPRWSPAISCIESSKGAACFRPHNAWGWGNSSWGSWAEAIDAHVAGLARGYGYTISLAAAKKYCPPTYRLWYSSVSSEMNRI